MSGLWVRGVPGTRGEQLAGGLTVERLGLDESYDRSRCDQCPQAFTTDGTGELIAWVDTGDLVVTRADDGTEVRRTPLGEVANDFPDLDLEADTLVVSYGLFGTKPPVLIGPDGTSLTLEGLTADVGPGIGGNAAPIELPPAPPPATDPIAFVTAGPDGVGAIADLDTEVRRLDQPADVAFATPGGAVIFQPAPTAPGDPAGDPLIWRADGTTERLLGELPAGQSYRLYDVADVNGVPTVLYGVSTVPAVVDPEGYREVLRTLSMRPGGWVVDDLHEMNTWEGGYSSLSVSNEGLVVGTIGVEASTSFASFVVPGSPAANVGPVEAADLGLDPTYGDCDCPTTFAVDSTNDLVVWMVGNELVVHRFATGEQDRWTVPALDGGWPRSLDIRTTEGGAIEVIVNRGPPLDEPIPDAVLVTLGPDGAVEERPLGTAFASFGP